eukprot:scaffold5543_cov119-Isochrysis_galbana.AAC.3
MKKTALGWRVGGFAGRRDGAGRCSPSRMRGRAVGAAARARGAVAGAPAVDDGADGIVRPLDGGAAAPLHGERVDLDQAMVSHGLFQGDRQGVAAPARAAGQ